MADEIVRDALRTCSGIPFGGESKIAAEKVVEALDKAGYAVTPKAK